MSTCRNGSNWVFRRSWKVFTSDAAKRARQVRSFVHTIPRLKHQPLRVLFCGSDEFSITSLKALNNYRMGTNGEIKSIDVATRTDKRTGRGLKTVMAPPIKAVAQELNLPLHQIDTFTGWNLPTYGTDIGDNINLIVTVSFGLLVPPRILKVCDFGGLNVHPSLLPDLKGAAPIEHSIIYGDTYTGISVQTMHPSKFDEGALLEQSQHPGIAIPNPNNITAQQLKENLAPFGAELLIKTISQRRYLCGSPALSAVQPAPYRAAPKIWKDMKEVDFAKLSALQITRLNRAIPKLWSFLWTSDGGVVRVQYGFDVKFTSDAEAQGIRTMTLPHVATGQLFALIETGKDIKLTTHPLMVRTIDGQILSISTMTVPGLAEQPAAAAAARNRLFNSPVTLGKFQLYRCHQAKV